MRVFACRYLGDITKFLGENCIFLGEIAEHTATYTAVYLVMPFLLNYSIHGHLHSRVPTCATPTVLPYFLVLVALIWFLSTSRLFYCEYTPHLLTSHFIYVLFL